LGELATALDQTARENVIAIINLPQIAALRCAPLTSRAAKRKGQRLGDHGALE